LFGLLIDLDVQLGCILGNGRRAAGDSTVSAFNSSTARGSLGHQERLAPRSCYAWLRRICASAGRVPSIEPCAMQYRWCRFVAWCGV